MIVCVFFFHSRSSGKATEVKDGSPKALEYLVLNKVIINLIFIFFISSGGGGV